MAYETQVSLDQFLFKLLARIGVLLSIILLPYLGFYIYNNIPQAAAILRDFDAETPAITKLVITLRWGFLVPACLGVLFGLVAVSRGNRNALSACWVCVLMTVASVVVMWQAIEGPITSIVQQLSGN